MASLFMESKAMTKKSNLYVLHIDGVNDDVVPESLQKIKDKVRPLLSVIAEILFEEKYTMGETMSVIASIVGRMYEHVWLEQSDKAKWARDYIENSLKLTMDSVERGHKTLQ
jgi:hypothetical protein